MTLFGHLRLFTKHEKIHSNFVTVLQKCIRNDANVCFLTLFFPRRYRVVLLHSDMTVFCFTVARILQLSKTRKIVDGI